MLFIDSLFGNEKKSEQEKLEPIEFTKKTCKHEVPGPDIGQTKKPCGKPIIKGLVSKKEWCSVDERHNINGPGDPESKEK